MTESSDKTRKKKKKTNPEQKLGDTPVPPWEMGFEILAFPCNDFGGQEPGTNEEIKTFCTTNYVLRFLYSTKSKYLVRINLRFTLY